MAQMTPRGTSAAISDLMNDIETARLPDSTETGPL